MTKGIKIEIEGRLIRSLWEWSLERILTKSLWFFLKFGITYMEDTEIGKFIGICLNNGK